MIQLEYDVEGGQARRLPTPGACIYCGAEGVGLTDEHVIPFAIGKDAIILERSCCGICQKIIQPYEQAVLRHQLGHFRAQVGAPTRSRKSRPTTITLEFVAVDERNQAVRELGSRVVTLDAAPLILNLWQSPPPTLLGEPIEPGHANGRPWHYVDRTVADPILREVAAAAGVERVGFRLGPVNRLHYLRSLAKTAHAFAAAELGTDAFEPFLTDIVLNRSDDVGRFVGDVGGVASLEGATGHDFKITLGEVPEDAGIGKGRIAVFMQFWGDLGSPAHFVIVGQALTNLDVRVAARQALVGSAAPRARPITGLDVTP